MACMLSLQSPTVLTIPAGLIKEYLRELTEGIQFYSKDYKNFLLMEVYNVEIPETNMSFFCEISM